MLFQALRVQTVRCERHVDVWLTRRRASKKCSQVELGNENLARVLAFCLGFLQII